MSQEQIVCNLSLGKAALQSSFSQYSDINDPIRALSGNMSGSFSFHTDNELNPWWMVDLGSIKHIKTILIYNRCDGAKERSRHLSIQLYDMAVGFWQTVYLAENEFGGFSDNAPLKIEFGSQPKPTRFIKIEIQGTNILHLDQVIVYGFDRTSQYKNRFTLKEPDIIINTSDDHNKQLGAIVALVRGYDDLDDYAPLIERNKAIFENFNAKVENPYPLLIFHEGNITEAHQTYILSHELNQDVRFIDVSEQFRIPTDVEIRQLEEGWPLGYRLMCKFNTWDIWTLTQDFKYILRIDEDCVLEQFSTDPFKWMEANDLDCGFSLLINDSHDPTHDTLPSFVEAYLDEIGETSPSVFPLTSRFPYTNLMLGNVSFFSADRVANFLSRAISEPVFYEKRWGDHIVLGVPLNLYSSPDRIQPLPGLRYRHDSHALIVTSHDELRERDVAFRNTYPITEHSLADIAQRERYLLSCYKLNPLDFNYRSLLIEFAKKLGRTEVVARLLLK